MPTTEEAAGRQAAGSAVVVYVVASMYIIR